MPHAARALGAPHGAHAREPPVLANRAPVAPRRTARMQAAQAPPAQASPAQAPPIRARSTPIPPVHQAPARQECATRRGRARTGRAPRASMRHASPATTATQNKSEWPLLTTRVGGHAPLRSPAAAETRLPSRACAPRRGRACACAPTLGNGCAPCGPGAGPSRGGGRAARAWGEGRGDRQVRGLPSAFWPLLACLGSVLWGSSVEGRSKGWGKWAGSMRGAQNSANIKQPSVPPAPSDAKIRHRRVTCLRQDQLSSNSELFEADWTC